MGRRLRRVQRWAQRTAVACVRCRVPHPSFTVSPGKPSDGVQVHASTRRRFRRASPSAIRRNQRTLAVKPTFSLSLFRIPSVGCGPSGPERSTGSQTAGNPPSAFRNPVGARRWAWAIYLELTRAAMAASPQAIDMGSASKVPDGPATSRSATDCHLNLPMVGQWPTTHA